MTVHPGWHSINTDIRFRMDRGFEDWRMHAACRGMRVDLFFPVSEKLEPETIEAAKEVCAGCPVRRECLAYAFRHREANGIWGGLTEDERRRIRRRGAA